MIKLAFCNQRVLVWRPSDVSYLRKNYRIVGTFIGSMPGLAQQNTELGLPLLLMAEEANLLVEKGLAVIVDYKLEVNEEMKEFYRELKNDFYKQNCEQFRAERKEAILQMSEKIISGKLKKFSEKYTDLSQTEVENEIIKQELSKIPDIKPENCVIKINTNCPLDKRSESVIDFSCCYPKTPKDVIRYAVFKDLWQKNYYLTDGIKFGSDFLCYESDPIGVHSKFMVICREDNRELTELDIQMYGRLARSVQKRVLIAFYRYLQQTDRQSVEYNTIEWQRSD